MHTQTTTDTLATKLKKAALSYYTDGTITMSDAEFDTAKDELALLDPNHPFLEEVGEEDMVDVDWVQREHEFPLGSLDKVKEEADLRKFLKRFESVIVEPKLDGISIALTYDEGKLVSAVTRGKNGVGYDITRNVKKMKGVPTQIPQTEKTVVRSEIVITYEDFYNIPEEERGKNPRNMCAGAAKKSTGEQCHLLSVVGYDIMNNVGAKTEGNVLTLLEEYGFPLVAAGQVFDTTDLGITLLMSHLKELEDDRKFFGYDIDGMVIKHTNINYDDDWKAPKDKIAWKFPSEEATTHILGIKMQVSGDRITPVADLEPVECAGVTISSATLHNWAKVENLGVWVGCKVLISRRNDVIPQVESVIKVEGEVIGELAQKPDECPTCSAKCTWEINTDKSQSKFWICPNDECESKVTKAISKWLQVHDSKGIAKATIELLYENEIYTDLVSFMKIAEGKRDKKIVDIEGMGASKLKTLKSEIEKTLVSNPIKFFGGLNFSGSGADTMERIVNSLFKTQDSVGSDDLIMRVQSPYDVGLSLVESFGKPSARKLQDQFSAKTKLITEMLKIVEVCNVEKPEGSAVTGKSFCFTGAMDQPDMKRKDAEKLVKGKGGTAKSSVGKDLDYLVTDDPIDAEVGSSKMKKACKLRVTIISSNEFIKLLG